MIIPVGDDRRIEFVTHEVQVQRKSIAQSNTKTQKKGDVNWIPYKFCSTIGGAIRCLEHEMYATSDAEGVEACMKEVQRVLDKLSTAIKPRFEIREVA